MSRRYSQGMKDSVQLAVIGAAHGIKGEVRVKSFTADPLALGDYGPLHSADGRIFEVLSVRPAGTVVVVRFKSVNDRTAAEALNGVPLFVDRAALPEADEEEFYHADLVGLAVRDGEGEEVGKVVAVHNHGGGDILEIVHGGRDGVLIPFSKAAVPGIDLKAGYLTIDAIAAGLQGDGDEDFDPTDRPRGPASAGGNR
jgi:16S rRNA processing protein RimM